MNRLPIRLKVTVAFTAVLAVVLVATGLFLYLRFSAGLDATIQQGLRSRTGDVSALVQQADSGLRDRRRSPLTERGEGFAQILDPQGHIVDASPQFRRHPALGAKDLGRAVVKPVGIARSVVDGVDEQVRLLASPVRAQDRLLVVVVGAPLGERDDALRNLGALLLLGGASALVLASLAGFGAATAALRPVERMRRRAEAISARQPGVRLPIPDAHDEVHRLGNTLNAMLGRLEEAFAHEQAFVADASHELRTPLAILKSELELALRAGRSKQELLDALSSAADETDRLSQLAEDLLVIARFDQGELPVRCTTVGVAGLLLSVRQRFARRAAEQGREVSVRAGDDLSLVADPLRLEQALSNLVDNALRHGAGTIELAAEHTDERVRLEVSDEGPGFADGVARVAFERFSRADSARSGGGAGLGLSIVDVIARAHGGSAHTGVRDRGPGAVVWVDLPAGGPDGSGGSCRSAAPLRDS